MRYEYTPNVDLRPGSVARNMLEALFGSTWADYKIVEAEYSPHGVHLMYILHCVNGPAAIKYNGDYEWWLDGKKLPCKTEKEFKSYMKNKVFW